MRFNVHTPNLLSGTLTIDAADVRYALSGQGGSGGGVSDHGALTGLGDDDHTQYFNQTRGDVRYALSGNYQISGNYITITEANGLFAISGNYQASGNYITVADADIRYALSGQGGGGSTTFSGLDDVRSSGWQEGDLAVFTGTEWSGIQTGWGLKLSGSYIQFDAATDFQPDLPGGTPYDGPNKSLMWRGVHVHNQGPFTAAEWSRGNGGYGIGFIPKTGSGEPAVPTVASIGLGAWINPDAEYFSSEVDLYISHPSKGAVQLTDFGRFRLYGVPDWETIDGQYYGPRDIVRMSAGFEVELKVEGTSRVIELFPGVNALEYSDLNWSGVTGGVDPSIQYEETWLDGNIFRQYARSVIIINSNPSRAVFTSLPGTSGYIIHLHDLNDYIINFDPPVDYGTRKLGREIVIKNIYQREFPGQTQQTVPIYIVGSGSVIGDGRDDQKIEGEEWDGGFPPDEGPGVLKIDSFENTGQYVTRTITNASGSWWLV